MGGVIQTVHASENDFTIALDNGSMHNLLAAEFATESPDPPAPGCRMHATTTAGDGTGGHRWTKGQRGTLERVIPPTDYVSVVFDRWKDDNLAIRMGCSEA